MEKEEKQIKAVHERDLNTLLAGLKINKEFENGELKCKFCGTVVSRDNIYSVLPQSGSVGMICDKPDCITKLLAYLEEKKRTKNRTIKRMNSIATFLSGGFVFSFVTVSLFVYFIENPHKVEKWASMIAWLLSHIWKKAEYFAIKTEIQGKLNSFVSNLESNTLIQLPRVSVQWTAKNQTEIIWEEEEAIIVMRDRKHKNKNFVHAAYFFTSEVLIKKIKKTFGEKPETIT